VSHIDPDDLALIALGSSTATPAQHTHLGECNDCTREVQALAHIARVGRTADDAELLSPPPAAWSVIHRELGLSSALAEAPAVATATVAAPLKSSAPSASPAPTAHAAPTAPAPAPPALVAVPPAESPGSPLPGVRGDDRARRRMWPLLVAAVLVGIIGGLGIGALSGYVGDRVSVVAEAVLDPLPGQQATGTARVEENRDGRRDVVVTVGDGADAANPTDGALREVWLLNSDATGLVSLGLLDGSRGRFVIPAGIDISEYPLVDVSVESADGNPAHSGVSVVRGQLHST
jgi:hypothetical protein